MKQPQKPGLSMGFTHISLYLEAFRLISEVMIKNIASKGMGLPLCLAHNNSCPFTFSLVPYGLGGLNVGEHVNRIIDNMYTVDFFSVVGIPCVKKNVKRYDHQNCFILVHPKHATINAP